MTRAINNLHVGFSLGVTGYISSWAPILCLQCCQLACLYTKNGWFYNFDASYQHFMFGI